MNSKRSSDEVTCSEAKETKTINYEARNNCHDEELEKEVKLLNISFPLDLEEIKEKKILHEASQMGYIHVVKELLKHKLNVDDKDDDENTALHLASENGHATIVAELLAHGANIELPNEDVCNTCNNCGGGTNALHLATYHGHIEVVKELLKYNPDLSKVNGESHHNALQIACKKEHVDIVKELLANGANVKEIDHFSQDFPILIAAEKGNLAILKELVKYGADPFEEVTENFLGLNSALDVAEELENNEMVEYMFLSGDLDAVVQKYGYTKLHLASHLGHIKIVSTLLEKGCNVNALNTSNRTPLYMAIYRGNIEIVQKLLQHGANINFQNSWGQTVLHYALEELSENFKWKLEDKCDELMDIIELLLRDEYEIDTNLRMTEPFGDESKTVLEMAIELSYKYNVCNEIVRMIAKKACLKPRISDSIYPLKHLL